MSTKNFKERYSEECAAIIENDARKRLAALYDNGIYTELDRFAKNGECPCEVVCAFGEVNGVPVYAFAQDSTVCHGAMGMAQAGKLERLYALAEKNGCPIVGIYDSCGGHIDEGALAMSAYGKLTYYSARLSGVVPQISVIAGACEGSQKLLADMADLVVGVGEDKNGYAAVAENDIAAVKTAAMLLSYLPQNNLAEPLWSEPNVSEENYENGEAVVRSIADNSSTMMLYGESAGCVKVYFARIGGAPAGIVLAADKDKNICAEGALKAARFVRMCDAFSLPVVTLIDAENMLCAKSAAALAHAYAEATVAKVSVVMGSAVGSVFMTMAGRAANADAVFAWDSAAITAIKPCTAVQLLMQDKLSEGIAREQLEKEYANDVGSPFNAAAVGAVDDVIAKEDTAARVAVALEAFTGKRVSTLDKKHSNMPL